ncbi:MAG: YggT family protein [Candidatus Peregrinibacteria bacterium]
MDFIGFLFINVIRIIKYAILLRVLMSWVQVNPYGTLTRIVYETTEPILRVFRNLIPRLGMIDISPILAFLALDLAQMGVMSLFAQL